MKRFSWKIGPASGGLRWLQWVAILIAVGLFAGFSLLLTVLFPGKGTERQDQMAVDAVAALLAAVIAPYLLRAFERMQEQSERQYHELRTQHVIDRAINAQYDLNAILQVSVDEATRAVDSEVGALALWREGRPGQIEERVSYGISPAMKTLLGDLLDDRLRASASSGRTERRADLDQTWQRDRLNSSLKLRNQVIVPITYQDQSLGALLFGNRTGALAPGQGYSDADVSLLEAVAGTLGVAIQNARFVRETRRRGEMLRTLVAHTGQAIAAASDVQRLMRLFAEAAATILGCTRVAVYGHHESDGLFVPLAAVDHRTGQGDVTLERFTSQLLPADAVLAALGRDAALDGEPHDYAETQESLGLPHGSGDFLAGPGQVFLLTARDRRCLGLLVFGDLPLGLGGVREFAQALASQAGVTLENARLFAELSQLYQREKRIAEKLQENLLPDIPARAGAFEFAKVYRAALGEAEIGGDFLDLFPLGTDRVGIVMADVSGKGLGAAVQTAAVKYTLRAFAHQYPGEPGRVLTLVNDVLCGGTNPHEGFVTLFFGALDTCTGTLVWSSAGHEPPLLHRTALPVAETLDSSEGIVLGCMPGLPYETHSAVLDTGDVLLLYTDGVTEARDEAGEFLGADGLRRLLSVSDQPAPVLLSRLDSQLRQFSNGTQRDDIAMLLIRHIPATPPTLHLAAPRAALGGPLTPEPTR